MLDSFKNPPSEFRNAKSGQDRGNPVLMRELKQQFDRQATSGINLVDIPPVTPQDYTYSRLLTDYIARVSYTLSLGKRKAQVALLQSPYADHAYFDLFNSELPLAHVIFDVIDEETIQKATAIDQRLICSDNEYELLILPPVESIAYSTAVKIEEFVEDGGRIMATNIHPTKDSIGTRDEEIASIFNEVFSKSAENGALFVDAKPDELSKILRKQVSKAIKPNVSIKLGTQECRDITYTHRIWQGAEIFFFANSASKPREVQLSIRCEKAPHILDPETGKRIALVNCTQLGSRTILLHRFEAYGSLLLCFDDVPSLAVPTPYCEFGEEIELPTNWNVIDNPDGSSYSQTIDIPEFLKIQRVVVDLEEPLDVVEFVVNGAVAGTRLWPPYEMDITALVKPGPNDITLKFNHTVRFCGRGKITIY